MEKSVVTIEKGKRLKLGSGDKRQSLLSNTQIWEEICNILPSSCVKGLGRRRQTNTEKRRFLRKATASPNLHVYTSTGRGKK
jgi:DNA polymerase sigma